ncbi:GRP family sugar transporter [Enterococcus faecium]|nr:GRP family sugar transporter [Enterococcus faecium]
MNKNGFIDCIDPGSWVGIQPLILKKIGGRPTNEILGTGIGAALLAYLFNYSLLQLVFQ